MRCFRHPLFIGLCVALASWLVAGSAAGQTAAAGGEDFARGNALYAEGKFAQAAGSYEAQVRRGEFNANLFYNLANAYYRQGERGRAILNYQRALLLEPTHHEAAANLAFVRGHGAVAASTTGGGWLDGAAGLLSVDAWTWVATAAGWLGILGLAAALFRRQIRAAGWTLALTGLLVGALAGGALYWLDGGAKNSARAVVLADGTRAMYSPADNAKIALTMPAGSEVRVLSEQGAWDYVQLGDGGRAWVSADRIEMVMPAAATRKIL